MPNLTNVQPSKVQNVEIWWSIQFVSIRIYAHREQMIRSRWNFFLPSFYNQVDRVQTDFWSDCPRKRSRLTFAPRRALQVFTLNSWYSVSKAISLLRHSKACWGLPNHFLTCFCCFWIEILGGWCQKSAYWSDFAWFWAKLWTPYETR